MQLGQLVLAQVKTVISSSKVIKCELLTKDNASKAYVSAKELTIHNLKPGFLVNAKVARVVENGLEVSFMGGFSGTIFVDHLDKDDLTKYKVGEKVTARII